MSVLAQIEPTRAKKKILEPNAELHKLSGPAFFAEEKKDGIRQLMHTFGPGIPNRFSGRRISEVTGLYTEKSDRLPHLEALTTLPGWVIDGEVVSGWGRNSHEQCSNTVAVMGSDAPRAIELQLKHGWNTFEVFDVLYADGISVQHLPLVKRLDLLGKFLADCHSRSAMAGWQERFNCRVEEKIFRIRHVMPGEDFKGFYEQIMSEQGEGLILKDLTLPYGHARAWWKWKRRFEMDVVLTGECTDAKYGKTGKFEGLIGAAYFGVYRNGRLETIGKCSGMDDATRNSMTDDMLAGKLAGKVITVSAYEVTSAGVLRNPNFERWRADKLAAECTWETQVVPNTRW